MIGSTGSVGSRGKLPCITSTDDQALEHGSSTKRNHNTQCARWHLTDNFIDDPNPCQSCIEERKAVWDEWLDKYCKNYVFQLERGEETGRCHFQLVISLKTKVRKAQMVEKMPFPTVDCRESLTKGNFDYSMKTETRVQGPWADASIGYEERLPAAMPDDIKRCNIPFPYQAYLEQLVDNYQMDIYIHNVIDPLGTKGKSTWARYMDWKKKAKTIPDLEPDKIMGFIMSFKPAKCYIYDIARTKDKPTLHKIWSTMENLKAGNQHDWRHEGKQRMITPPMVVILSNQRLFEDEPEAKCEGKKKRKVISCPFTKKRLIEWLIDDDNKLKRFTIPLYKTLQASYRHANKSDHCDDPFVSQE